MPGGNKIIIENEVEIGINGRNIKHYESLGYYIPRKIDKRGRINFTKGVKIRVKIEHLMKTSKIKVLCKCEDCGLERYIEYDSLINRKNSSYNKTGETLCSECANHRMNGVNSGRYIHGNNLYPQYRSNARIRGYEFELTIEEFENLIPNNCFYCSQPSNGIDRWDNNIGYIKENCVPCCKDCNFLKQARAPDIFIEKVKQIYLTLEKKGLI